MLAVCRPVRVNFSLRSDILATQSDEGPVSWHHGEQPGHLTDSWELLVSVRLALSGAVIVGFALSGASYAQEVCDPYSQDCQPSSCSSDPELAARNDTVVTTGRNAAGETVETTRVIRGCDETVSTRILSNSTSPSTLPFTGGELVTMTAIGGAALAGGVALVVAGRRRRPAQDA